MANCLINKNYLDVNASDLSKARSEIDCQKLAYGITLLGGNVHESITKEAAKTADMPYGKLIGRKLND